MSKAAAVGVRPLPRSQQSFWPREHGAYGQLSFPLVAALAVAGPSAGGLVMTLAVVTGFLAHEPAAVLLGHRGPRARREHGGAATRWLTSCLLAGATAAGVAFWVMPPAARVSIAIPAVPAIVLAAAMLRNREKSWYGEGAAALAFSGAAVPVARAAGASLDTALAVAIPFALLFLTSTLAIRVVILRVRGGGDPRAAAATRRAALAVSIGAALLLVFAARAGLLASSIIVSTAPGLVAAATLALRPPLPTKLRQVGWTLVSVSVLTMLLVVATA